MGVIDDLWRHPGDCGAAETAEKWAQMRGEGSGIADSCECFGQNSTWGSIDLDWKVSMVLQHSKLSRGAFERA